MIEKHPHCTAICAMPSSPEAHSSPSTSWQQVMLFWLCGNVRTAKIENVLDVVPSSTKYGERPSEERRRIMRKCWGRYEMRMPTTMSSLNVKPLMLGVLRLWQLKFCSDRSIVRV